MRKGDMKSRRRFLTLAAQLTGSAMAFGVLPPSIRRALAIPAKMNRGTIDDVRHVVILMQENRSFDHYFGTLRGVRGFRDRHVVPMAGGKSVWMQSDGKRDIPPYHLNTATTSAISVPKTPLRFADAQAAWNQGRFGEWPKFKTPYSMGHYQRSDIPFQFALAEAFTLCDAYHCTVTSSTVPNRIAFFSGSNFDPCLRARGENCTDSHAEPDNLRCEVSGALPRPGYTYQGSAFEWPTIPDILEKAGISWRIYQDPNDNWSGNLHPGLAFASFRTAQPGSSLYRNGMTRWSMEQFEVDAKRGNLPAVSWIIPAPRWSEHPEASTPPQGAQFTARVLDALTANAETWGRTVFFLLFDEGDGFFDHVPPPAPPTIRPDGTLAGGSTLDLAGEYFSDPARRHLFPGDDASGSVRPWGLGPRVPMYAISPWSKGGWVNSQVFDHTSIGQFLERRFGIAIPNISPWHRAVCGDLTSAFDFSETDRARLPLWPATAGADAVVGAQKGRPKPLPPSVPEKLFQEPGVRPSRALPYVLNVHVGHDAKLGTVSLHFINAGRVGAVFHVYDRRRLDRLPQRYTVEAGRTFRDNWQSHDAGGNYDLWVYGPNGFVREFKGRLAEAGDSSPCQIEFDYDIAGSAVVLTARNAGGSARHVRIVSNAYRKDGPWLLDIPARQETTKRWNVAGTGYWYDFTACSAGIEQRFAGRMETGRHGISDTAA